MKRCKDCTAALFGPCNDACRPEREALQAYARHVTSGQKHSLGSWQRDEGGAVWRAVCVDCGAPVVIRLDPEDGESAVDGAALFESCCDMDRPSKG